MAAPAEHKPHADVKTPIWQVKAYDNFVRGVLIDELTEPGARVLELQCGKGVDLGKWHRAKIGSYIGLDSSLEDLSEAQTRWEKMDNPFHASFVNADIFKSSLDTATKETNFDVICCFAGVHPAFTTEDTARQFLRSVSAKLRPGGVFMGIMPDSGAIWYRAQKERVPHIKGQLFSIEFRNDEFPTFGTRYRYRADDGQDLTENLVHFPSFISTAREFDLSMLEMANFESFLEDHKRLYPKELAKVYVTRRDAKPKPEELRLMTSQQELITLYTTFIFQKGTVPGV